VTSIRKWSVEVPCDSLQLYKVEKGSAIEGMILAVKASDYHYYAFMLCKLRQDSVIFTLLPPFLKLAMPNM
jgi:hypothetical protein